ncbi:MAG: bifunctional riboflavin kinase/FAD synthetase [Oscillospiraceae bacterium]
MIYSNLCEKITISNKTVVAIGFFDGIHTAHQSIIKKAVDYAKNNQFQSAVFTFCNAPTSKQSSKLLLNTNQKNKILLSLGVDFIISPDFNELKEFSAQAFIKQILVDKLQVTHIICGEDFKFGKDRYADTYELKKIAKENGITFEVCAMIANDKEPISATRIRDFIAVGNIKQANILLGRNYFFSGTVIHGKKLARTIDFPTINQKIPTENIVPKYGVYATKTNIEGMVYPSITNIGVRPTIDGTDLLAETHIIDFDRDLYDKDITVEMIDFIRIEKKFKCLEELKHQIAQDMVVAKKMLNI